MEVQHSFIGGWIQTGVQWLRLGVETVGALIIVLGVVIAFWQFVAALMAQRDVNFNSIRLSLARYLALALEFQLGADILSTAFDPTADQIGKLAAIAVIRTGLNYFLSKEMQEEQERMRSDKSGGEAKFTGNRLSEIS